MMTDAEQTQHLNRLRDRLQSIAIQAVQAQALIGSPDQVTDLLDDIGRDLAAAERLTQAIATDAPIAEGK